MTGDTELLKEKGIKLLLKNRITHGEYEYICPDLNRYPWQWLWDSCFHVYYLKDSHPELAYKELHSLMRYQTEDGFVPHMSYHGDEESSIHLWGIKGHSGLTQPPIIGWTLYHLYKATEKIKILEELYSKVKLYYIFLKEVRDHNDNGLISIVHPWESGWDDSPRWDEPSGVLPYTRSDFMNLKLELVERFKELNWDQRRMITETEFNVSPVCFNSLYALSLKSLHKIAQILKQKDDIELWENLYLKCTQSIKTKLWDQDKEMYQDLYYKNNQEYSVTILTPATFFPMFLDIPTDDQVKKFVGYITNPKKFGLKWILPTVSADEITFDPNAYWRGTVWINVNFLTSLGLIRYGYEDLVEYIAKNSVDLIKLSGFREYFNPLNAEGLGAKEFGWSSLAANISALESQPVP